MFFSMLTSLAGRLADLNEQLTLLVNSVAGRSWLFDNVVAFFLDNDLVKAGVIGACFLAAWYGGKGEATTRRRKTLLTTIAAAVGVLGKAKLQSEQLSLLHWEIL